MNALTKAWNWFKAKFGRIVTALGAFFSGIEAFDISVIKDPLESIMGHKGVAFLTVGLFALSWGRHQYVASKHPKPDVLPPPQ